MRKLLSLLPIFGLATGGCIAKTAVDVVTLPVRAASKGVDWATTSQSEADRNYGRKMRKAEEREGKERRQWARRCRQNPECGPYDGYVAANDSRLR